MYKRQEIIYNEYNELLGEIVVGDIYQIRKNDIPKRIYREVHTGPKTQLGGLKEGLFNEAYQVGTAWEVNIPATAPTDNGNKMDIISLIMWDIFITVFVLI